MCSLCDPRGRVANLRKTGITQILVGALDEKMLTIAQDNDIPSMPLDGSSIQNRGAANLRFDYSAYKRMAALKVAFYTRILTMGFNIWACDADTGWMGDPSVFIQEYPMQHVRRPLPTRARLAGPPHPVRWALPEAPGQARPPAHRKLGRCAWGAPAGSAGGHAHDDRLH